MKDHRDIFTIGTLKKEKKKKEKKKEQVFKIQDIYILQ